MWMRERCVRSVSKQNHSPFFKLNWTLNRFGSREIWHTVVFAELQCKRSWEVKTGRRSWAKRTKSVCCFSACWSWVESKLSVLFCATLEVCGEESLKDEVKGSIRNSRGPVHASVFLLRRCTLWDGAGERCQIYNSCICPTAPLQQFVYM